MPYIKEEDRKKFEGIRELATQADTCGELNYLFTLIAQEYLIKKGLKYQNINDVVGALDGAKMEFYRRIAVPYEDDKIKQNGDVKNI